MSLDPMPDAATLRERVKRHNAPLLKAIADATSPAVARSLQLPVPDLFAGMNGTERARAIVLEAKRRDGLIRSWRFEEITFKLAPDLRYTPDFFVVENDGAVTVEETKGFWRDDAKVKIRIAARLFPEFRFRAYRLVKRVWVEEEYHAA